jgi:hypothetical protein
MEESAAGRRRVEREDGWIYGGVGVGVGVGWI